MIMKILKENIYELISWDEKADWLPFDRNSYNIKENFYLYFPDDHFLFCDLMFEIGKELTNDLDDVCEMDTLILYIVCK